MPSPADGSSGLCALKFRIRALFATTASIAALCISAPVIGVNTPVAAKITSTTERPNASQTLCRIDGKVVPIIKKKVCGEFASATK